MNDLIKISSVSRRFASQKVLDNVNLSFPRNGLFAIVGHSGSGKSTLLNILAGLDVSYEGKCTIGSKCLKEQKEKKRLEFRLKHIGYVFQDFRLLELETVLANVCFPCDALVSGSSYLKRKRALDLLTFVGLKDKANAKVSLLSGGEKQRVALCRALINDPNVILADEPSGALDEKNGDLVFRLLKSLSKRKLVIVVSHDEPLVSRFADCLIRIKDGKAEVEQVEQEKENADVQTVSPNRNKETPRLSSFFLLGHAWRLMRAKKIRTAISETSIAIGILGLGLSTYVSNSISSEMSSAFSSIVETNQIHFSKPNPSTNPIDHIYSAPLESVSDLAFAHKDLVEDYGTSYPVNFEEYYVDSNEFFVMRGVSKIVLPSFSIRSINDYLWLDDYENLTYFPSRPKVMEDDQVVLGLPYSAMFNLCFGLQILRNYESLGNYIVQHGLKGVFSLANYSWGYEDEQMLNIVAVTASTSPCFYHLNHHWTTYMFEEQMRFPASDHKETSLPWVMNKVHYLSSRSDRRDLLQTLRKDESTINMVFLCDSYEFNNTSCPLGESCDSKRLYAYIADKYTVPFKNIDQVSSSLEKYGKVMPLTTSSYISMPSSLLSGTALKFFVSPNEESISTVIDSYSRVKEEDASLEFEIPPDCFDANYIKASSGGLKIYPSAHKVLEGRYPSGIDEVAITKGLADKIGPIKELSIAGQVSEKMVGHYLERSFSTTKVKVVGVVDNDRLGLEVDDYWSVDFFLLGLGMSAFTLEPTGGLVTLFDGVNKEQIIRHLSQDFPQFRFSDPSESVSSSIESTIGYVSVILSSFSFIALSISVLLFIVVVIVFISENKKEASLLYVVGISRKDIIRSYCSQAFLFIFLAFTESCLAMILSEYVIHLYIGASFLSTSAFTISWPPFAVMSIFALSSFLITTIFIWLCNRKTIL
ncbi:MAG: ABC transporter ATP-binding protein/permease [Bacilli bacterium]|nr:ABC transporter ATP-binding protein/permease [Bacilli bacterium]